jgi:hypothetical protein
MQVVRAHGKNPKTSKRFKEERRTMRHRKRELARLRIPVEEKRERDDAAEPGCVIKLGS